MTDKHLTDKVAIITGAASGIGLAIAERYVTDGAKVVISDINVEQGQAVAEQLGGLFVGGDLSKRKDCQTLVDKTIAEFGTVHVLVNNAGFQHVSPVEDFSEDRWDTMLALMLTAPFLLSKYVWPSMKAQRWGRIIMVSSVHGLRASPFKAAYISAKHGVMGLTKVLALEGANDNITSNAICPAYVRTPLVEAQIADQATSHGISENEVIEKVMLDRAVIKRLIEPEEVAALASFLCRDEASAMTGVPIPIDLGWMTK